jgi:hypothetical protein
MPAANATMPSTTFHPMVRRFSTRALERATALVGSADRRPEVRSAVLVTSSGYLRPPQYDPH